MGPILIIELTIEPTVCRVSTHLAKILRLPIFLTTFGLTISIKTKHIISQSQSQSHEGRYNAIDVHTNSTVFIQNIRGEHIRYSVRRRDT